MATKSTLQTAEQNLRDAITTVTAHAEELAADTNANDLQFRLGEVAGFLNTASSALVPKHLSLIHI